MMLPTPISWRSSASRRGMHEAPRNTLRWKYSLGFIDRWLRVVAELGAVVGLRVALVQQREQLGHPDRRRLGDRDLELRVALEDARPRSGRSAAAPTTSTTSVM